jgi:hypothetical protein
MGVLNRLDRQQRGFGLDVMHVLGIGDAGVLHGKPDAFGDLLDHGGTTDVLRQDFRTERGAHDETGLAAGSLLAVAREYGCVRGNHAVAAAGPDHRDLLDRFGRSRAVLQQDGAECLIGQDAGEIIDAAIAFGLADNGDDFVGSEIAPAYMFGEARGVHHALDLDLGDFNGHERSILPAIPIGYSVSKAHWTESNTVSRWRHRKNRWLGTSRGTDAKWPESKP